MTVTWDGALLEPSIRIHWLFELGGIGTTMYFADSDVDYGRFIWEGALVMNTPPAIFIDPYTATPSSPNCVLTLLPVPRDAADSTTPRPYDLEAILKKSFLGATGKVYRYAEGSAWFEAQLLLNGYIHEATLDEAGNLRLTIVDRILKYNRGFPRATVNKTNWPNCYDDDQGAGYPILYGQFDRIPVPVIDDSGPTYDYMLVADGTIGSITAVYYDDVALAGGYELQADIAGTIMDSKKRIISRVAVERAYGTPDIGAVGDKAVTITGAGVIDDTYGTYSGNPSTVLNNPATQMLHMGRYMCGMLDSDINFISFRQMQAEYAKWRTSPVVDADDNTTFFDLRTQLCQLMRAAVYPEKGLMTGKALNFFRPPKMNIIEKHNLVSVQSIEFGDKQQLITQLIMKYRWGWFPKKKAMAWKKSIQIDASDRKDFAENRNILRGMSSVDIDRVKRIDTRHIYDDHTADFIAQRIAELHGKPRKVIKLTVDREGHTLEIYDTVTLTLQRAPDDQHAGWTNKRFVVIGIQYGTDTNDLTLLES